MSLRHAKFSDQRQLKRNDLLDPSLLRFRHRARGPDGRVPLDKTEGVVNPPRAIGEKHGKVDVVHPVVHLIVHSLQP
jgi:hypothetical protein